MQQRDAMQMHLADAADAVSLQVRLTGTTTGTVDPKKIW